MASRRNPARLILMQNIFDWTLRLFLFLSPIFTFKNYQPSFAKGVFFICGSIVIFSMSMALDQKRKLCNKWISGFLLLAFIPVFFRGDEFFNFWGSMYGFFYVLCGVMLFKSVYCYCDSVKNYIKPIIIIVIMNFVLALCQLFGFDFMWVSSPGNVRICGFMEISTQLGQYSAMVIPLLLSAHPIFVFVPLTTLLISGSSTPMMALVISLMVTRWRFNNKIFVIAILSIIFIWAMFHIPYMQKKFHDRPLAWKNTLLVAMQKPYIGWGYQSFNDKVNKSTDRIGSLKLPHAYNDYFHTVQELGFPILVLIGFFFYEIVRKFNSIKNKDILLIGLAGSVIVILVNMLGQSVIRFASISGTFIILLAFLCVEIDDACRV